MLFAHEHLYERHWPVYNKTVFKKGDVDKMASYVNPLAPVQITTGSAVSLSLKLISFDINITLLYRAVHYFLLKSWKKIYQSTRLSR